MNYLKLLENSYKVQCKYESNISRFEYLSEEVFDFTTYDGEMDELLARKALEVCAAVSNKETFDYIKDGENYKWFLLMCNMPFFCGKLEWGTSIRGAWWDLHGGQKFKLSSCWFYEGDEQIDNIEFNEEQWIEFITDMNTFIENAN